MITFDCPDCDEEMEIADRMAGQKIECVNCGKRVRVPDEDDEEEDDRPTRRSKQRSRKHETKSKAECKEIAGL